MTFLVGVDASLFCLVLQHFFLADGKAVRSKQNPFNISVVIVLPKNMGRKPMVPRGVTWMWMVELLIIPVSQHSSSGWL